MTEILEILQSYIDEKQKIETIIYLIIFFIQTIINLFIIIDYIKSKSNTKLLIATTLIMILILNTILFIV